MKLQRDLLLSRRRVLQLFGGAAALMTPICRLRAAEAGASDTSLRFIVVRTPNGTHREAFWPEPVAASSGAGPAVHDLTKAGVFKHARASEILDPLYDHRADLSILKGIGIPSAGVSNQHYEGCVHLLTNSRMVRKDGVADVFWTPSKASIDQMIAARTQGVVASPSLNLIYPQLGTGKYAYSLMGYGEGGAPVAQTGDMVKAFNDVFGLFGADVGRIQQSLGSEKSVLDYTLEELKRVQKGLSGAERAKLEQHMESVRSLELKLVKQLDDVQKKSERCPPDSFEAARPFAFKNRSMDMADLDLMVDFALAALSCDLTRVVTMVWVPEGGQYEYFAKDFGYEDIRGSPHSLSHYYQDPDVLDSFQKEFPNDTLAERRARSRSIATTNIVSLQRAYATRFSRLLTGLKGIDDGGQSLLQRSAVLWGSTMSDGSHNQEEIPFVLAGHAGGRLKQGQMIDYKKTRTNAGLLLSLADAFSLQNAAGAPLAHFGDEDLGMQVRMAEILK